MSRLWSLLELQRVLLMDGAMGTELQKRGWTPEQCAESWNLTRPEFVRGVHRSYRDAGATCFLTNTFQANPTALAAHGCADELEEIIAAGVRLARGVAGAPGFVFGDIGPVHDAVGVEFGDLDALARIVAAFDGVEGLLLETCSTPRALTAVEFICRRVDAFEGVPVLLSVTYHCHSDGSITSRSGHAPETFARHAAGHGVAALGVNCGRDVGLRAVAEIVRRYRAATDLPLFARPNAGTPTPHPDGWHYPVTPAAFAAAAPELLAAGVVALGGCCGTTPEHIAALRPIIEEWNARREGRIMT
jgi:5-methyltetrahydrofolate--homocysteine methyltransferase